MAGKTKDSRVPLPDSFVAVSNEMTAIKEEYDEYRASYEEAVKEHISAGFSIAQIAEVSPFTYATLRNWYINAVA